MVDEVQGAPTEEILKLVLPFLDEKRRYSWNESDIFNRADLVCKQWNTILKSDVVWRPICDRKIAWYEMVQRNGKARRLESNDPNMMDVEESEFDSPMHMILATQMKKRASSGRSFREIFVLSERMRCLDLHGFCGPDYLRPGHAIAADEDNRTLRDRCTQDYQRIIFPTITTLRQVFHDPDKTLRQGDVANTKRRLLGHARKAVGHARKEKALLRDDLRYLEKEKLAANMGQTLLAAATISFKPLCENVLPSSSSNDTTIGTIASGLITIGTGGDGSTLDWPLSPVDNLCCLIHKVWIHQHEIEYNWDTTQEEKDEMWEAVMRKWWASLADPIRLTLIEIYNE